MPKTTDSRTMNKKQRCTSIAILILAAVAFLLVMPAAAHSPSDMTISYDPNTAKIYVTVNHQVADPDYKSQPTKDTFTLTYDVNAASGDEIWVTATCVRGGVLEKTYKVPEPVRLATSAQVPSTYQTPPKETVPPTARSPAGLLSLLGAVAAVLLIKRE